MYKVVIETEKLGQYVTQIDQPNVTDAKRCALLEMARMGITKQVCGWRYVSIVEEIKETNR